MKTAYFKGYYGQQAETGLDLPDNRFLKITTMKRASGNLATTASVGKSNGDSFSFVVFQDFNKTLASEKVRVTEKAVKTQHDKVLENLDALKAEIAEFYSKEESDKETA